MDGYRPRKRSFFNWGPVPTELSALLEENGAWNSLGAGQILPRRRSFFGRDGFRAVGLDRDSGTAPGTSGSPLQYVSSAADRGQSGGPITQQISRGIGELLSDGLSLLGGSRRIRGAGQPGRFRGQDGSIYTREADGGVTGPLDKIHLQNGYHNMADDNGGVTVPLGSPAPKVAPPPKSAPLPYDIKPGARIGSELEPYLRETGTAYTAATGRRLVATDGFRTSADQAAQMFKKFRGGEASLYRNRNALKPILQVYTEGRRVGLNDDEIRAGMTKVIQKQVDNQIFVSPHLNDHGLDIRIRKLSRSDLAELRKAIAKAKGRLTPERDHYHVQFPRKSTAGGPSQKPGN